MASVLASVGEVVKLPFLVTDVDGITPAVGLLDAAFGKTLIVDDAVSALPVTVTEIVGAAGRYSVEFTPDAAGLWRAEVLTPFDDYFARYVEAGPPPDDWVVGLGGPGSALFDKLCDIHKIMGLDPACPLCVSKTSQEACDVKLKMTEVGTKIIVTREP